MALDVALICRGLAEVVEAGTGLTCHPTEPDQLDPPCAFVALGDPFIEEPHESMVNHLCRISLVVRLVGGTAAGPQVALESLWPYLSGGTGQTKSILDAIYDDTTFRGSLPGGGVRVLQVSGPRAVESVTGQVYLAVDVPLFALATRS